MVIYNTQNVKIFFFLLFREKYEFLTIIALVSTGPVIAQPKIVVQNAKNHKFITVFLVQYFKRKILDLQRSIGPYKGTIK